MSSARKIEGWTQSDIEIKADSDKANWFTVFSNKGDEITPVSATLIIGGKALTEDEVREMFDALLFVTKFVPQPQLVKELNGAMREIAKRYITP